MARARICKPSPRVVSNKNNGRLGGLATAKKHGEDFCIARSEKAGQAVKAKYGSGYYSHINSLRKKKRGWKKGVPRRQPDMEIADPLVAELAKHAQAQSAST